MEGSTGAPENNRMPAGNLFAPAPRTDGEWMEDLLATGGFRLERIVSRGEASLPGFWYDQPEHEWVVLLSGAARLEIEGRPAPVILKPGDYVFLPAHCRHRVAWTDPSAETVWLALFFPPVSPG